MLSIKPYSLISMFCLQLIIFSCKPIVSKNETQGSVIIQTGPTLLPNKKAGFYLEARIDKWEIENEEKNLLIKTNLINNTSKEINYIDYNCAWTNAYVIDNKDLGIYSNICNHNFPVVYTIFPYSIEKEKILRIQFKSMDSGRLKLRIGLIYVPFTTYENVDEDAKKLIIVDSIVYENKNMPTHYIHKNDKGNIIWSDTLLIEKN